jgi:hypothetical protein
MVDFKGPSQEKRTSEIFRFGYGKASNDKRVPDPVGSEVCVLLLVLTNRRQDEFVSHSIRSWQCRRISEKFLLTSLVRFCENAS